MKKDFVSLVCAIFLSLVWNPLSAGNEVPPQDAFDWREIPDSAILHPQRAFTSDRFVWVSSSGNEIRILFVGPQ
jgi:hypothetical protein